jgi:hypothetical protein
VPLSSQTRHPPHVGAIEFEQVEGAARYAPSAEPALLSCSPLAHRGRNSIPTNSSPLAVVNDAPGIALLCGCVLPQIRCNGHTPLGGVRFGKAPGPFNPLGVVAPTTTEAEHYCLAMSRAIGPSGLRMPPLSNAIMYVVRTFRTICGSV